MKRTHFSLVHLCVSLVFIVIFLCPISEDNLKATEDFVVDPDIETLAAFSFPKVCTGDMKVVSKPYDSHGSGYCETTVPLTITLSESGNLTAEYNFGLSTMLHHDQPPTCTFEYENPYTKEGTHDSQGNFTVSMHIQKITVTGTYGEYTMTGHGIKDTEMFFGGVVDEISFTLECEGGVICPPDTTECGDDCCSLFEECCGDFCCSEDEACCGDVCCDEDEFCEGSFTICLPKSLRCPFPEIYGEYSEEVELLRAFRDEVLSQSPVGQEIIELYYLWSPAIVRAMEADAKFKEDVKEMIDGVLELITEEAE